MIFCLDKALEKAKEELVSTTSAVRESQLILHIDNIERAKRTLKNPKKNHKEE